MKKRLFVIASIAMALAIVLSACATPTAPPPVKETVVVKETQIVTQTEIVTVTATPLPLVEGKEGVLTSAFVAEPPVVDGNGGEAAWAAAPATVLPITTDGIDGFDMTIKSVCTADMVYFLIQYPDSNMDVDRSEWAFDPAAKAWGRLGDDFGDEDEFGFWWNMTMPDYDKKGCFQACHGETMLAPKGTFADDWRWNSSRTNPMGWVRDFIMTDNPDADPAGGFTKDEGYETNRGYIDNVQDASGVEIPLYWKPFSGAGGVSVGDPRYILQSEIDAGVAKKIVSVDSSGVLTDDSGVAVPQWVHIPGRVLSAPSGPSWNDITGSGMWFNGVWTVEWARKLVTGHDDDIQFSDLGATYYFDGYVKTRQPGEGAHGQIPTTPFVFAPVP